MTIKSCTHHWLLESPEGNRVRGQCKRCGTIRVFTNQPRRSNGAAVSARSSTG